MDEYEYEEATPRAFCDDYTVHEQHVYRAINRGVYHCPGLDAATMAEIVAEAAEECEHGMSRALCTGPQHF